MDIAMQAALDDMDFVSALHQEGGFNQVTSELETIDELRAADFFIPTPLPPRPPKRGANSQDDDQHRIKRVRTVA
jgi:hypothetical protein